VYLRIFAQLRITDELAFDIQIVYNSDCYYRYKSSHKHESRETHQNQLPLSYSAQNICKCIRLTCIGNINLKKSDLYNNQIARKKIKVS